MSIIPTSRGNPQASDVAVEVVLPMTGNSVREDAQSTLALNDAEVAKLYEDRNAELSQGGLISFSGTQLTFTEVLTLEINSRVAGGAPVVIPLGVTFPNIFSGPFNVAITGDMVYAVIDRIAGTAVVTDNAATLPPVNASNQEVYLIGKRNDAADGTKRFYFRDGTAINSGQTIRLGAPTGLSTPAGLIQMYGGVSAPAGYLLCDGTAYLVADYPDLATALFDTGTGNYAFGSPVATAASYTGTIAGTSTPVTLTANTAGTSGNSIDLVFNSVNLAESLTFNSPDDLANNANWVSQGFTATANATVTSATWELSYVGALPGGTLTAQIYTNVGGVPGSLLATSNTINGSSLGSSPAPFVFTFTSGPTLSDLSTYCLVLNTSGATFGIGTNIVVSLDNTAPYSGGSFAESTNSGSTWPIVSGFSAYFSVDSAPSINVEITDWNTANPSNQLSLSSGDGTQTPSNGASAQLSGGLDAGDQFNVPYFGGLFPRGWNNGGPYDPDASSRTASNPGGNTGDNIGSYESDAISTHTHTVAGSGGTGSNQTFFNAGTLNFNQTSGTGNAVTGSMSSESRPKNLNVNFIIKF